MKRIILTVITGLIINGCGGVDNPEENKGSDTIDNTKHIIYDNDHFDPDWVIGLHMNKTITIDAIVLTGTDIFGKAGLKYQAILEYYGLNIPIGINHRSPMRTTPDDASANYPNLDSRYKGGYRDIMEFPSDGLLDSQRQESVALLCETLSIAKDKSITYIIGGHLQNFRDLLKEKDYCDGYNLVHSKIKELVINTGGFNGKPETNLSEGSYRENEASRASRYVLANTSIPIILTAAPNGQRPGDIYLDYKIGSPQEFIIAVPRYGTYGDHGISDNPALFVGVYGMTIDNVSLGDKIQGCLSLNKNNAIELDTTCKKENYIVKNFAGQKTTQLLLSNVKNK